MHAGASCQHMAKECQLVLAKRNISKDWKQNWFVEIKKQTNNLKYEIFSQR